MDGRERHEGTGTSIGIQVEEVVAFWSIGILLLVKRTNAECLDDQVG